MRLAEDIKPVAYMRTKATELLKQVNDSRRPVVITQNGEARAVVLDIHTYEALRDAMVLLQIAAQGDQDVREGQALPQQEALARVGGRLKRQ